MTSTSWWKSKNDTGPAGFIPAGPVCFRLKIFKVGCLVPGQLADLLLADGQLAKLDLADGQQQVGQVESSRVYFPLPFRRRFASSTARKRNRLITNCNRATISWARATSSWATNGSTVPLFLCNAESGNGVIKGQVAHQGACSIIDRQERHYTSQGRSRARLVRLDLPTVAHSKNFARANKALDMIAR